LHLASLDCRLHLKKHTGVGELGDVLEDGDFGDPEMSKGILLVDEKVAKSEGIR
jgi:hypothetical protein